MGLVPAACRGSRPTHPRRPLARPTVGTAALANRPRTQCSRALPNAHACFGHRAHAPHQGPKRALRLCSYHPTWREQCWSATTLETPRWNRARHWAPLVVDCDGDGGLCAGRLDPARDRADPGAIGDRSALWGPRSSADRRVRHEVVPHLAGRRISTVRALLTRRSAATFAALWIGFIVLLIVDRDGR